MFRRLLVPLDGSAESEDVLADAARVADPAAEIFLLHVGPVLPSPPTPLSASLGLPETAFAYLDRVRQRLRHSKVRTVVRQGDPAEEIQQAALELGADLLALTTHGRSGLRRVLMGSVAEELVRRGTLPVLLARPGCPRPGFELRDILVPLDGTARSARILDLVKPLAAGRGSLVRLVHVVVPITISVPLAGVSTTAPSEVRDPRPELRELARPLKDAGIKVRVHVSSGYAAAEILRVAREAGSDLIAMATSGRRGLARLFLGSVAEELLRDTDRPILLLNVPEPRA